VCPTPADHSPRRTALRFLLSADPLQLIEKKLTERPSREDAQAKNILQKGTSSSGRPLSQCPQCTRARAREARGVEPAAWSCESPRRALTSGPPVSPVVKMKRASLDLSAKLASRSSLDELESKGVLKPGQSQGQPATSSSSTVTPTKSRRATTAV
jgi:hypothetical protein